MKDIEKLESKLSHMAMYDALTNLPNRAYLHKEAHKHLSVADRFPYQIGFMFVDLDGFKTINDTYNLHSAHYKLISYINLAAEIGCILLVFNHFGA